MLSEIIRTVLFLGLLLAAAAFDWRTRRIPNALTLSGFVAGLGWLAVFGERGDWISSGLGLLIGGGSMLLLYLGGGMGGGDVKLMAGLGVLGGYETTVYLLFYGCLAALAILLAKNAWNGTLGAALARARGRGACRPDASADAPDDAPAPAPTLTLSFALALAAGAVWIKIMEWL